MRKPICASVALAASACVTPLPVGAPEFPQRAAPPEGQYEIELLAGFDGRLAIKDGCLGATSSRGNDDFFVTIVWPANAKLERTGSSWRVRNEANGETIAIGQRINGGGGFRGDLGEDEVREYNRMLTRKLSPECAAKGTFGLNRDFRRG